MPKSDLGMWGCPQELTFEERGGLYRMLEVVGAMEKKQRRNSDLVIVLSSSLDNWLGNGQEN